MLNPVELLVMIICYCYIWVFPKSRGKPPKWMVKIVENPIKIRMIWGGFPYFRKHPDIFFESTILDFILLLQDTCVGGAHG